MNESELNDIQTASASCQSLDADAHGKIVRLVAAYRLQAKGLAHAQGEVERIRKPKPKSKAKS